MQKLEIPIYFVCWIGSVLYSNYRFYKASEVFLDYDDIYNDFTSGWNWINRRKDVSDPEWNFITASLIIIIPFLIIHTILTEMMKYFNSKLTPYIQLILTFLFLAKYSNYSIIVILLLQPLSFELFSVFGKISLMWICCMINLIVITYCKSLDPENLNFDQSEHMLLVAIFYWANLRCVSFYCDKVNGEIIGATHVEMLAFVFYLPVLLSGPFVSYKDYKGCCEKYTKIGDYQMRIFRLSWGFGRIIFWTILTEILLHFIYVNAMAYQLEYVGNFDSWALYGYGYAMGQFFHLKYVIFYGLATVFSEFEGASMPDRPWCIGRIHIYSDMWKHFDQGLHKFLLRYIYIPIIKGKSSKNKLTATFLSFAFVYVWHGLEMYIFKWTVLNFIGILVENEAVKYFHKSQMYKGLSENNKRRIGCAFAAPLLALLTINSYSFISGLDIGIIFYKKFFTDIKSSVLLTFFLYTCCQISEEIKMWNNNCQKKAKTTKNSEYFIKTK